MARADESHVLTFGAVLLRYALAGVVTSASLVSHAGKLDRVRDATSSRSSDDDDDDGGDDDDDGLFGALLGGLFSRGSNPDAHPQAPSAYFTRYPYAEGHAGNMFSPAAEPTDALVPIRCPLEEPRCSAIEDAETCVNGTCYQRADRADSPNSPNSERQHPAGNTSRLQLFGEAGTDVDGLHRGTLGFWTESIYYVALESRWSYWSESLADGERDELVLGDLNLIFRIAQSPHVQAHLGAGGRLLADTQAQSTVLGFNGTVSVEAYPMFPLAIRFCGDLGNLGPAFVAEGQASLGIMWRRAELYAGYGAMLIGPVGFHGPLAGVRLHF